MAFVVTAGSVTLPSGVTTFKRGDELLWSEGTGRGATSGKLVGTVIANKATYTLEWGVLTNTEYQTIRTIPNGFFNFTASSDGVTLANISAYRGAITGDMLTTLDGVYWKGVSVSFIER